MTKIGSEFFNQIRHLINRIFIKEGTFINKLTGFHIRFKPLKFNSINVCYDISIFTYRQVSIVNINKKKFLRFDFHNIFKNQEDFNNNEISEKVHIERLYD